MPGGQDVVTWLWAIGSLLRLMTSKKPYAQKLPCLKFDLIAVCFRASRRRRSRTRSCVMQMNSTSTASRRVLQFCCFRISPPCQHSVFAADCGLPVCSRQDGQWIKEDEEASVNRGTSKPGTWCFVFSKLNHTCLLSICFCHLRSCSALRTDCYGFTIPST